VDHLTLQRSLTLLENRYRELREIGENHLQTWESEKAKLKQELDEIVLAKACLETEIKKVQVISEVLASEKKDLEEKLQEASLKINSYRIEKQDLESQLKTEKQDLESQLKDAQFISGNLKKEKQRLDIELKDIRDELELRMLQLLQAQEELQHYFLKSQELTSAMARSKQAEDLASQALNDLVSSTSWRMTYPVRWALDQVRMFRREGYKKGSQEIAKKVANKAKQFRKI
jgi:hypothetical protein